MGQAEQSRGVGEGREMGVGRGKTLLDPMRSWKDIDS